MKKFGILLGILVFAAGTGNAQEKGLTVGYWDQSSIRMTSLNGREEFQANEIVFAPGYAFNRSVFVRAQLEGVIGLWDHGERGRTYRLNSALGASVGWNAIKSEEWGIVELAAATGNSMYNRDWSYLFCDFGISWLQSEFLTAKNDKKRLGFLVGIGARYYNSHNSRFENYCNLYLKVGFRFN